MGALIDALKTNPVLNPKTYNPGGKIKLKFKFGWTSPYAATEALMVKPDFDSKIFDLVSRQFLNLKSNPPEGAIKVGEAINKLGEPLKVRTEKKPPIIIEVRTGNHPLLAFLKVDPKNLDHGDISVLRLFKIIKEE